jgi:hypothetical protein
MIKHAVGIAGFLVAAFGADSAINGSLVLGFPLLLVGLCSIGAAYAGTLGIGVALGLAGVCLLFYAQWWPAVMLLVVGIVVVSRPSDPGAGLEWWPSIFSRNSSDSSCDSDGGGGE